MLVLALDTSSATLVVGLLDVDGAHLEVATARTVLAPKGHGEVLAGLIAECAPDPAALEAVVVGAGPGPFTGLRVGLVTAASIADACRVPLYGVCSLDAVDAGPGEVLVVADARRREVYWARYRDGVRVEGPSVGPAATVQAGRVVGNPDVWPGAEPASPDVATLVRRAQRRLIGRAPGEHPVPRYLRRPDAVEPPKPRLWRHEVAHDVRPPQP